MIEQTESQLKSGALLVAGLIAGGLAAYFVDGLPDMALPAVAFVVMAIALYIKNGT
ncbi:hypothetical protein [Halobaculum sp. EA56]|uniref:hypothetical protein n=1 Tax=Halobaculum sp. EA56 TaxID=3421648 RepID=UPI003EBB9346